MDMQHACAEVLAEVDGSLGCIVIDMRTGLTVAAEYQQGSLINPATINLVSVLSTNMFQGKLIRQFEGALARPNPVAQEFVREVQMTTEHTNQFMAVVPGWNQMLLVLVTDKTVSVGLGWMAVHRLLGRLGEGVPPLATAPINQPPVANPAASVSPRHEPFPDANRYAPPPIGAAPQAPTRRYRGAVLSPEPASGADAEMETEPQAPTRRYRGARLQPEPSAADAEAKEKPKVVMGPRMSMYRRK